jgi:NADH:ubiquinone oxidoreductase subunit 6 (subunit J)
MVSVLSIMNALGQMIGFLLPFVIIKTNHVDDEVIKKDVKVYLFLHAIISTLCFVLTLLFMSENKQEVTEESGKAQAGKIPMKIQIKCLFTDLCYVSMFVSAAVPFGLLGALGNVVSLVVSIWGFQEVSLY